MKLQQQVSSQEPSKRLKELGFPQESLYVYTNTEQGGNINTLTEYQSYMSEENFISAYSVAELGEMLPENITVEDIDYTIAFTNGIHSVGYEAELSIGNEATMFKVLHEEIGLTEADARAKMLIYLKENNLI